MTKVLRPVLDRGDLPEAELYAARLDGELFAVDECFAPVDSIDEVLLRATALAMTIPLRLIAELATAAWIHGATLVPPARLELCSASTERYRLLGARFAVREVVLRAGDTMTVGGLRVTTPLHTAGELLRRPGVFDSADAAVVAALASIGDFDCDRLTESIAHRPHLPGKRRALDRIDLAVSDGAFASGGSSALSRR